MKLSDKRTCFLTSEGVYDSIPTAAKRVGMNQYVLRKHLKRLSEGYNVNSTALYNLIGMYDKVIIKGKSVEMNGRVIPRTQLQEV